MSLPPAVRALTGRARFWSDYFWEREPDRSEGTSSYPELADCAINFPVSRDYGFDPAG